MSFSRQDESMSPEAQRRLFLQALVPHPSEIKSMPLRILFTQWYINDSVWMGESADKVMNSCSAEYNYDPNDPDLKEVKDEMMSESHANVETSQKHRGSSSWAALATLERNNKPKKGIRRSTLTNGAHENPCVELADNQPLLGTALSGKGCTLMTLTEANEKRSGHPLRQVSSIEDLSVSAESSVSLSTGNDSDSTIEISDAAGPNIAGQVVHQLADENADSLSQLKRAEIRAAPHNSAPEPTLRHNLSDLSLRQRASCQTSTGSTSNRKTMFTLRDITNKRARSKSGNMETEETERLKARKFIGGLRHKLKDLVHK